MFFQSTSTSSFHTYNINLLIRLDTTHFAIPSIALLQLLHNIIINNAESYHTGHDPNNMIKIINICNLYKMKNSIKRFAKMYLFICMIASLILVTTTEGNGNINKLEKSIFCSEGDVKLSKLKFTLYTQSNGQQGIHLTEETLNQVDAKNFTTLIIHGWNDNSNQGWIQKMKNVYLNKSADNIIIVDWSIYAAALYPAAVCYVPQVGVLVGELIYNLTKIGVDVKEVQINGFSLGAHVSGAAGQRLYNLTLSKVGRINGLDAAGPEFLGAPISERLDATDADFVQAIHTNGGVLGYSPNYGTIDFHVNFIPGLGCGTLQNGCPIDPGVPILPGIILPNFYCDHVRAAAYFLESINSNNFIGSECPSCLKFGFRLCRYPKIKTVMGENCPRNETGVRYLNTHFVRPFAKG